MPEEPDWWAAAPLRGGHRTLAELPAAGLLALIRHYLPFVKRTLRVHRDFLAEHLGDRDDVDGQAAEWLLDAMRCYDSARGVPFAGYLNARAPHWIADAVRGTSRFRRYAMEAETICAKAVERSLRERHRAPTLAELAEELGESPDDTAERLRVVALARGLRRPTDVDRLDVDALPVRGDGALWARLPAPDDGGHVDVRLLTLEEQREVTAVLIGSAYDDEDGTNARGLWTLLLEQLGGYTRRDLERAGHVGRVAIVTAQQKLLVEVRRRLAAG